MGRSTGKVPTTVAEMATHALDFMDALCLIEPVGPQQLVPPPQQPLCCFSVATAPYACRTTARIWSNVDVCISVLPLPLLLQTEEQRNGRKPVKSLRSHAITYQTVCAGQRANRTHAITSIGRVDSPLAERGGSDSSCLTT